MNSWAFHDKRRSTSNFETLEKGIRTFGLTPLFGLKFDSKSEVLAAFGNSKSWFGMWMGSLAVQGSSHCQFEYSENMMKLHTEEDGHSSLLLRCLK